MRNPFSELAKTLENVIREFCEHVDDDAETGKYHEKRRFLEEVDTRIEEEVRVEGVLLMGNKLKFWMGNTYLSHSHLGFHLICRL